jgi:hypothetical protein
MIKAATKRIKALNDNPKSFAELSRSMTQLLIPNWSPKEARISFSFLFIICYVTT